MDMKCIYGYFPQFLAQLNVELIDGTRGALARMGNGAAPWTDPRVGRICWTAKPMIAAAIGPAGINRALMIGH